MKALVLAMMMMFAVSIGAIVHEPTSTEVPMRMGLAGK